MKKINKTKLNNEKKETSSENKKKLEIKPKRQRKKTEETLESKINEVDSPQIETALSEENEDQTKIDELSKLRKENKNQAIKKVEQAEKEIVDDKTEKIVFEEYVPKFYEKTWFRWAIIGGLIFIIGLIALIVSCVNRASSQLPKSIAFSTDSQIYWNSAEDITLRAYLNSSYSGSNKKILLSVSGGNGIVSLPKTEIESGDSFTIRVNVKAGYPVGGKVKIWAIAKANGIATSVEILIDSPVTSIAFNEAKGESEIYVLDSTAFEALAKRGDDIVVTTDDVVTGRKIKYEAFYEFSGGDYKRNGNKFEKVSDGEGDYKKLSDDIATISNNILTANSEAKLFIQATVKKWSDYNTGSERNDSLSVIKEINCKRIDLIGIGVKPFYKDNVISISSGSSVNFEYESLLNVSFNSSIFTTLQKNRCLEYIEIELSSENAQIINKTKTGFAIKAETILADEIIVVSVKYKNNNGDFIQDYFSVKLQAN